ncbi:hypothetical protein [Serratia liquefaciens]|uniref:hypothetical protein n=1 Tax=Serratia liquefaciens TaxID=614 RepID=UPI0022B9B0F9|nr:hypothetical protein [Serratia liquefaciens]
MKVIDNSELYLVSGAGNKDVIQYVAAAGTYAVTKNTQASLAAGLLAGEIYEGGYKTAPGVSQGLGSFNPNYNPALMGPGPFSAPNKNGQCPAGSRKTAGGYCSI